MGGWSKNDMVELVPGPGGRVRVWRAPTQAELWKWIRDASSPESAAPKALPEDFETDPTRPLVVAEEVSELEIEGQAPGALCRILDLETGTLWWVARESVRLA